MGAPPDVDPAALLPEPVEAVDLGVGGEGVAAALAYTAVVRLGGAKAYPSVDREGMGLYYDAAQLSDTVENMRPPNMSKVRLPHVAIEGNAMPPPFGHIHETTPGAIPLPGRRHRTEKDGTGSV